MSVFVSHMKRPQRFQHVSVLLVSGTAALALATWVLFRCGFGPASAVCVYMIILVLTCLLDSLVASVIFSVLAVGCLDFYFQEPLFTFGVANTQDHVTLIAFLITSIIVTSLVRRLQQLGQGHREKAHLLDLTYDSVLLRDLEYTIKYWNHGSETLYGWKREEAVGKDTIQLLQTIAPAPLEQITAELFRSGHWEGQLIRTKRDGTQITVASRWSVQLGDEGQPVGIIETTNDITEQKRAENALRRFQETYLAEAQQLSHTGSFGWNVASGEISWSEEGLRICGFVSGARPSIESVLARVHPDDLALVRRLIDRAANDQRDLDFEYRLLLPDGTVKHIRVVARAMRSKSIDVDFAGAMMDVTSIRLAEHELEITRTELAKVMRMTSLGELAASIAHEVNQPLAAAVADADVCLSMLARESPDLNEVSAAISRVIRHGHRASEVLRRIRALIKGSDTQMVPLEVNEIVSDAVNSIESELYRYQVSLRMELSSDLPAVFGDRIQLQQVLLNLLMNSIEAMHPITDRQRGLVIRSEQDETRQVRVTVMDCGVGLPAESTHRIFDAFVTTKSSGIGMGLSICRSIIQAHLGRIWASANEPYGAAVQFTLPPHRRRAS